MTFVLIDVWSWFDDICPYCCWWHPAFDPNYELVLFCQSVEVFELVLGTAGLGPVCGFDCSLANKYLWICRTQEIESARQCEYGGVQQCRPKGYLLEHHQSAEAIVATVNHDLGVVKHTSNVCIARYRRDTINPQPSPHLQHQALSRTTHHLVALPSFLCPGKTSRSKTRDSNRHRTQTT